VSQVLHWLHVLQLHAWRPDSPFALLDSQRGANSVPSSDAVSPADASDTGSTGTATESRERASSLKYGKTLATSKK